VQSIFYNKNEPITSNISKIMSVIPERKDEGQAPKPALFMPQKIGQGALNTVQPSLLGGKLQANQANLFAMAMRNSIKQRYTQARLERNRCCHCLKI
jgi:hypothetical protein